MEGSLSRFFLAKGNVSSPPPVAKPALAVAARGVDLAGMFHQQQAALDVGEVQTCVLDVSTLENEAIQTSDVALYATSPPAYGSINTLLANGALFRCYAIAHSKVRVISQVRHRHYYHS